MKAQMNMDWDKLKVFHAAAEAGSFTHAGEQLGLSQSAVSRQVSALEQELSVSLFHRHARGLILTEQGDLLFRTAHDVFMQLQAARAKLTDSRERPSGDLKITTTPGVGINWLIPRLGEFTEPRDQPVDADAGRGGDLEITARPLAAVGQFGARRLELHEHVMRGAEQEVALLGEDQAAGVAMEQRDRELLLQRGDLA